MISKIKKIKDIFYLDLFFILCFFISLPISGVTAIQNISFLFFATLVFIDFGLRSCINLKKIKIFIYIFSSFLSICLISIFFSIDPKETFSEIRGEVIKPFFVLLFIFIYIYLSSEKKIRYLIITLIISLLFHSIINLYFWYEGGFWPFRAGGLLDNGGGERFGIWATYAISISIALYFTKYRKVAILMFLITFVSIIGNNTRATFIGLLFIFILYFIFIYRNRILKSLILFVLFLSVISFVYYSKNFNHHRYNVYNMFNEIKYLKKYTPNEFDNLIYIHKLGNPIVVRLAMWKSVILYRIDEPFLPLGYGRFLFDKQLNAVWEKEPQNIPYRLYNQPHSDFISILFSLGIIGIFVFILFLIYLLRITYHIYLKNEEYSYIGIFIFLGTIGYIGSMMFGSFFGDSEQLYFYALYGMALALYVKTKDESDEIKVN